MPFAFGDEPTNTGDTVGIQCVANKGDLPVEIRWVQNGSPIVSGENGITILKLNQKTSSLNINSVEGMHRGIFKCIVSNKAGIAEHSSELKANGLCLYLNGIANSLSIAFVFFRIFLFLVWGFASSILGFFFFFNYFIL